MSQQGGMPTGHEDDWWRQLYDSTDDTGPTPAPDTLDDRFASASGTVRDGAGAAADEVRAGVGDEAAGSGTGVPAPRTGVSDATAPSPGRHRPPWEPPPPDPPASFPPGPRPPGFASTETPPATTVPPSRTPTPPTTAPPHPSTPPRPAGRVTDPADAGAPRGEGDWWAAPPDPDRDAGAAQQTSAVTPPRGGPGSTQANPTTPTTEPPGHGQDGPAPAPQAPRSGPGSTQANPTTPTPEPPGHGQDGPAPAPQALRTATRLDLPTLPPAPVGFVGSGPPTYDAEPTALPPADPDELDDLVADTVLDGARYGACTLRAVSVRGDSARFRGEPRRDSLLTARFGTGDQALILVAMATGARATPGAHRAAAEACHWIGRAIGRSHARLAQDIGAARRGDLKSGLHRLTDRSLGKLRASAVEQGIDPEEYAATLRCLLLPADPDCRVRVFFGVGAGGLFRLRDGEWHDIEPRITDVTGEPVVGFGSLPPETPDGDRLTMDLGIPTPPSPYEPAPEPPREAFRFRASVARPGDTLLMCTGGLADPLRGEPELGEYLTGRWSGPPPGLAEFLADSQVRVKGYADDRTAAAVWEA
ncbi:protein phosphatase 2C domain-containing protein [Streptomyces sp. NPDC097941]|uniref:protein phosphatase 2C domain-containing protein n=1 Tax=Streptomyces sp. NPDC097941 TaxID=3155685 RepID=UPI00332ED9D9